MLRKGLSPSIPAPAGEPGLANDVGDEVRVYPRACGGTAIGTAQLAMVGLTGSIPAPAGEPNAAWRCTRSSGWPVYPRACGGYPLSAGRPVYPRACGGTLPQRPIIPVRSIPAPAGEPIQPHGNRKDRQVYPRACGGTAVTPRTKPPRSGLSPRLRGNLGRRGAPKLALGSIPAPAGEPSLYTAVSTPGWVYPRACGGTSSALLS